MGQNRELINRSTIKYSQLITDKGTKATQCSQDGLSFQQMLLNNWPSTCKKYPRHRLYII